MTWIRSPFEQSICYVQLQSPLRLIGVESCTIQQIIPKGSRILNRKFNITGIYTAYNLLPICCENPHRHYFTHEIS
jgi:hypothetical protein